MAADGGEDGGLDDGELADPDRVPGVTGVELMIGGDGTLCRNCLSWCKRSRNDCGGRIASWGLREPEFCICCFEVFDSHCLLFDKHRKVLDKRRIVVSPSTAKIEGFQSLQQLLNLSNP